MPNDMPPRQPARPGAGFRAPSQHRIDRGRGFQQVGDNRVEVYDLDLAAWFDMQGVAVADAYKVGNETVVTFYDPEDRARKLAVAWLNSEASQFASRVRQLKKIVYSTARHRT